MIKTFVEITNTIAEKALRELIVQRKIFDGLRKEKRAKIIGTCRFLLYINC